MKRWGFYVRLRKILFLVVFWVVVTPLLLEVLVRAAVPILPPYLQLVAERVITGTALDINRIGLMTMDIDHNFMMLPNINNQLYGPGPGIAFHVSTVQVQDSRMGFRSHPFTLGDEMGAMVVGDSFSFCFTEFEDCWVTRFAESTGLPTFNTGQGSTGSVSHWRFIDTFGRTFKPPLVIWQFWVNDFNEDYQLAVLRGEIPESDVKTIIPDYPDEGGEVVRWLRSNSVAWVVAEVALGNESAYISDFEKYHFSRPYTVEYNGHTLNFGQNYERIATNVNDPRISSGIPMTRDALVQAKTAVEGWGGKLVVIILPTREEVYRDLTAPIMGVEAVDALGAPRRIMNDICIEQGLTCLDLLPIFQTYATQGEHLYYTDDMHLNPLGNAILAAEVETWLSEMEYLPK
jgi:hypothetical protein